MCHPPEENSLIEVQHYLEVTGGEGHRISTSKFRGKKIIQAVVSNAREFSPVEWDTEPNTPALLLPSTEWK